MNTESDIERQAAEWIVRRDRADETPERHAAFEAWLAADARHRKAYLELQAPWQQADALKSWRPYEGVLDSQILKKFASPRKSVHWPQYAIAASLVIAVIAAVLFTFASRNSTAPMAYTTDIGGYQRVILQDGSVVQLNTDTQIQVRLLPDRREVRLMRGEAYFAVAHNPSRPFEVFAANTAVRAIGTAFTVRMREREAVEVVVTEGRVALRSNGITQQTSGSESDPVLPTVGAGEAAVSARTGIVVRRVPQAEVARRLAWQEGELSFQGETLDKVIMELNRYNRRKLEIADPTLATLQVGGNFQATDLESFVRALERSFNLHAEENAGVVRLSKSDIE